MKCSFFIIGLMAILVSVAATAEESHQQDVSSGHAKTRAAIAHIMDDNAKFSTGRDPAYFASFKDGQDPLATVVACSDSRVHMHAVDQTPDNDVFVIRNIGN